MTYRESNRLLDKVEPTCGEPLDELITAIRIWCDNEYARIFNTWKRDSGVRAFQVKIDSREDYTEFTIYTDRPDYMVGFKGELVNKYKAILKEAISREVSIKFIETTYCF